MSADTIAAAAVPAPRAGPVLAPGDVVAGRYRVVRALGRGSFGHTFLAVDTTNDHEVAIKQLHADGERGWKAFELFEREAAALRSLRHHGIPEIHDHLRDGEGGAMIAYLVMEYVEGDSLEQRIEDHKTLDPAGLLQLTLGLLDILDYLHTRMPPVLHRDIKPANVILRPNGAPALVDFGAVRTIFRGADERGSTVVGTFGYMPFEQYMGQASPASDLYAVGATLLHLVTGRPPSDFASSDGAIEVPEALPGGPVLRDVVARLLSPSASARYQSATEVRAALLKPVLTGAEASTTALARVNATTLELAPAPRAIEGELKERFDRTVLRPSSMLFSSRRPTAKMTGKLWLGVVLIGVFTLGILPLAMWIWADVRRSRARPFFERGVLATGRILQMQKNAMDWIEITYEFTLDGVTRRGADTIFPAIARLWHPGDTVELLVLPDEDHDSIIVSSA